LSTTIQRINFLVNTEVFRTQPLLGDQWSREMRNCSLCCSARFSAINIPYYLHRSSVLLNATKFHATVNTYRLISTASARFTHSASTFASAKVTVECVSEVPVQISFQRLEILKSRVFMVFLSPAMLRSLSFPIRYS